MRIATSQFTTFALSGFVRAQGDADSDFDHLWQKQRAKIDDYNASCAWLSSHRGYGIGQNGCEDCIHGDLDEDVYMKQPEGCEVQPERNSKDEIAILKDVLNKQFAMKDFGDAHHFLGMHIKRDRKRGILELSQEEYIHKVLQRFNMQGGKALSTPMAAYVKLSKND
ncbi:hypothetical protein L7F22_026854 [Adiantum nelumboides]|nr:hypothetical protein [Adiantum nelumboides]